MHTTLKICVASKWQCFLTRFSSLTLLDTVLELLHAKFFRKDSGTETFSVSIVMVNLFSAWFGVFGLIT